MILNGKNLMDQLPRKKSSKPNQYSSEPELPLVRLMYNHIEGKVIGYSRADISQGHASAAVLFEEFGDEDEGDGEDLEAEDHSGPPVEEDTSVEGEDVSQVTPSLARRVSELSNPITAPVSQSPLESPRHSSVAESIIAMKKSGKSFSRYSKSLRS